MASTIGSCARVRTIAAVSLWLRRPWHGCAPVCAGALQRDAACLPAIAGAAGLCFCSVFRRTYQWRKQTERRVRDEKFHFCVRCLLRAACGRCLPRGAPALWLKFLVHTLRRSQFVEKFAGTMAESLRWLLNDTADIKARACGLAATKWQEPAFDSAKGRVGTPATGVRLQQPKHCRIHTQSKSLDFSLEILGSWLLSRSGRVCTRSLRDQCRLSPSMAARGQDTPLCCDVVHRQRGVPLLCGVHGSIFRRHPSGAVQRALENSPVARGVTASRAGSSYPAVTSPALQIEERVVAAELPLLGHGICPVLVRNGPQRLGGNFMKEMQGRRQFGC